MASTYNCQLCHPSCAEYRSKNGCPPFHFPSKSSRLVMGSLPLQCLKSGFCDRSSHCPDSTIFLTIFGAYCNMVSPHCWPWYTVWAFNPSYANGFVHHMVMNALKGTTNLKSLHFGSSWKDKASIIEGSVKFRIQEQSGSFSWVSISCSYLKAKLAFILCAPLKQRKLLVTTLEY